MDHRDFVLLLVRKKAKIILLIKLEYLPVIIGESLLRNIQNNAQFAVQRKNWKFIIKTEIGKIIILIICR